MGYSSWDRKESDTTEQLHYTTTTKTQIGASLVAQRLKRLPTMWETWVRSLGREDPLEKDMATHSSTLAWKSPWTEKPGRLQSMGHKELDTTEQLHFHFSIPHPYIASPSTSLPSGSH